MKRRLDLALALVHRPRILFLDEPTTGLDPQSRNALWNEVDRLAKDEGVTVFLTTQYLEEADVLADRVGIIDHGKIVAEGTPEELKATIGRPTVVATPKDAEQLDHAAAILERFGEPTRASPGATAVMLNGKGDLADVLRALDGEGIARRRPAAARAVARRRLPREDGPHARGRRGAERVSIALRDVGLIAWRSSRRTMRQPAAVIVPLTFPLILLAVNSNGLKAATRLPGFPTHSFLAFFLPFAFIQGALFAAMTAGTDLARDIDTGFFNRLALTPLRGMGLVVGQLGGALTQAFLQAIAYLAVGLLLGVHFASGAGRDPRVPRARAPDRGRVGHDRHLDRAAHGLRRSRAVAVPAPLLLHDHLVDEPASEPDRGGLVQGRRDAQPRLVHDRGAAQPRHRGLERAGARARLRRVDRRGRRRDGARRASRCGRG